MEFVPVNTNLFQELAELQIAYKEEIGEDLPQQKDLQSLKAAIEQKKLHFYGCVYDGRLVACCSICLTFSTYSYDTAGVFEDFYILPEYRHNGIARQLVKYAFESSQAGTLTVGCADCDIEMYKALGFSIPLGNMLAYDC